MHNFNSRIFLRVKNEFDSDTLFLQIDNSVVESFAEGGKVCITSRVYPITALDENAHLYVFNNGTETVTVDTFSAWSMSKPLYMNQGGNL